jgi:hypothetical protein
MNKDGQCLDGIPVQPDDTGCQSYCEVKITYFYGQEIPYNFDCRADAPCTLTTSESVSHTDSWSIEVGATIGTRHEGSLTYNEAELTGRDDAEAPLKGKHRFPTFLLSTRRTDAEVRSNFQYWSQP